MKTKKGFMALISVIIISVILLLVASTLSTTGFRGRLNILDAEYKERSSGLAEACIDTAILRLAQNSSYAGGSPSVSVGGDACDILAFNPNLDPITLKTKAIFQKAVTNLQVQISKSDLSVISWQELPNF